MKIYKITEASEYLGVSINTLKRADDMGKVKHLPRIRVPRSSDVKESCEFFWSEIVKARAYYRSEISGKDRDLNAHHILGKSGKAEILRYDLRAGVCITGGEHMFGAHGTPSRRDDFEAALHMKRCNDLLYCRHMIRMHGGKRVRRDMTATFLYLKAEYEKLRDADRIRESDRRKKVERMIKEFWK